MKHIKSLFVYGTLRPDDISNAPWTKPFIKGFKYQKAHFQHGIMFHADFSFPTVSLLYTQENILTTTTPTATTTTTTTTINTTTTIIDENELNKNFDQSLLNLYKENQCKGIVGYVLSIDESLISDKSIDPIKLFEEKLKEADEIEEYPTLYKRSIIKVKPIIESKQEQEQTIEEFLECYIYHRNDIEKDSSLKIISNGDWLDFVINNPHIINKSV